MTHTLFNHNIFVISFYVFFLYMYNKSNFISYYGANFVSYKNTMRLQLDYPNSHMKYIVETINQNWKSCTTRWGRKFRKSENPHNVSEFFLSDFLNSLLLLLLLLKEVSSARLGESDIHPISPKTPAPQYQPIDRKKRKGKRVEDYSRDRAA